MTENSSFEIPSVPEKRAPTRDLSLSINSLRTALRYARAADDLEMTGMIKDYAANTLGLGNLEISFVQTTTKYDKEIHGKDI